MQIENKMTAVLLKNLFPIMKYREKTGKWCIFKRKKTVFTRLYYVGIIYRNLLP